jgi:hypothetical protein
MAKYAAIKRKILLLTPKSFLHLRQKDLRIYTDERPLQDCRKVAPLEIDARLKTLVTVRKDVVWEHFWQWKRILIPDEVKVFL